MMSDFLRQSPPITRLHCDQQYPLLTSKHSATRKTRQKYSLSYGKSYKSSKKVLRRLFCWPIRIIGSETSLLIQIRRSCCARTRLYPSPQSSLRHCLFWSRTADGLFRRNNSCNGSGLIPLLKKLT